MFMRLYSKRYIQYIQGRFGGYVTVEHLLLPYQQIIRTTEVSADPLQGKIGIKQPPPFLPPLLWLTIDLSLPGCQAVIQA